MSIKNLELLFNPRRIAVLGASEDPKSLGYSVFRNLIGEGFKGAVYPVNPNVEAVQGVEAYRKITDIHWEIDLAILANPCEEILTVLEECGQKEVKSVVILCPDFNARAKDPQLLETKIINTAIKYGFRILGPNSLGFIRPGIKLNASLFPKMPQKGNIAFISQSSTLSTALLDRAVSKKVGFSYFASLGAKFDIDFADMIDFLGVDPETRAIIIYVESIKNGRSFMTAVRSFACSKPIVVVKSGKFDVSAQVALTHSGILAGEDKVYDAAFKRAGAIRVDEMLDLFYLAETLAKQRRPKGNRLAIISNAGGPAIIAVDTLLKTGGELAALDQETINSLKGHLPTNKQIKNPIDLLSDAPPKAYEIAVESCMKDHGVDGVLVIQTPSFGSNPKETAEIVVSAVQAYSHKPVFTTWMGEEQVASAREILNNKGIPTFVTPEQAVRTFIYMHRYDSNLRLLLETPEAILKDFLPDKDSAEKIIRRASDEKRLVLTFYEVKEILLAYGIPAIPTMKAQNEEEVLKAVEEIGYPVVLKIDTPKIFHKLKKGGVILNIKDRESVIEAFRTLIDVAKSSGDSHAQVVVQPMIIKHGYELVLGARKNPTFGSAIVFGTGGELLEALEDYSIGLPPLNQTLARGVMKETKIYRYLQNQPSYKNTLRYLEEVMVRFSQLIIDFPQIYEIDINPFFVTDKERFAFDAGILLEENVLEGFKSFAGEFCPPHLSICPYPVHFVTEFILKNGIPAVIRPIRPEDEPMIDELFKSFSERSMSMRFFQRLIGLRHEQLVRYCQVDYDRAMAFVCAIQDGSRERIIGDVRLIKQPDLEIAEMAIMVGDPWQGQGVGKNLCNYCIKVAKETGVKKIWMEILRVNSYMLNLSERLGFKQVSGNDENIRVVLDI